MGFSTAVLAQLLHNGCGSKRGPGLEATTQSPPLPILMPSLPPSFVPLSAVISQLPLFCHASPMGPQKEPGVLALRTGHSFTHSFDHSFTHALTSVHSSLFFPIPSLTPPFFRHLLSIYCIPVPACLVGGGKGSLMNQHCWFYLFVQGEVGEMNTSQPNLREKAV